MKKYFWTRAITILGLAALLGGGAAAQIGDFSWKLSGLMALGLVLGLFFLIRADRVLEIPILLAENRRMILRLGRNDFRTRFAGSMFGTVWAFVQPIITVFVYWFVFEKALHVGTQSTKAGIQVPYVLWLLGGLVPWFFFSDALSTGTGVFIDYSYLVKKVVFNISSLPVVKIISALFVHLFFMAFTVLMYAVYGYFPNLYMLQMAYYSLGMVMLVTALVYFTSAIVVFFRDLTQIINISLQVGVWFTPIMWNIDAMRFNPVIGFLLKLNPMYYVVTGYRDALVNRVWFWERPVSTLYFWLLVAGLFMVGSTVFRRLRIHFADVL